MASTSSSRLLKTAALAPAAVYLVPSSRNVNSDVQFDPKMQMPLTKGMVPFIMVL
jgi:hypothetical protein